MTSKHGPAALRSKRRWENQGDPKSRKDKAKYCPYCGMCLGLYKNRRQREFAEQATPIEIKCPRCGEKS